MKFGSTGGHHDVVGVHVQHLAVGLADDHDRARVDTDDVVAQFAGEHGYVAALRLVRLPAAATPESPAPITTRSACWRRNVVGAVVRRSNRIDGRVEAQAAGHRPPDGESTRRPGRAGVRQVRVKAIPSISAQQFPQSPARHKVPPCCGC